MNDEETRTRLAELSPDALCVCAYGALIFREPNLRHCGVILDVAHIHQCTSERLAGFGLGHDAGHRATA